MRTARLLPRIPKVFEPQPSPISEVLARRLDVLEEPRIVLQLVVRPVLLRSEADEDSGRLPFMGNDDLLFLRQAQVFREMPFDLSQCYLLHECLPLSRDGSSGL